LRPGSKRRKINVMGSVGPSAALSNESRGIHLRVTWTKWTCQTAIAFTIASLVSAAPAPDDSRRTIMVALRKITESEYRHSIADLFGPDIKISARFEPVQRVDRLLALGSAQQALTSSGFEQYAALAASIADQLTSKEKRATVVTCSPAEAVDETCARQTIEHIGERLFRRPLTPEAVTARVQVASLGGRQSNDFYAGIKLAISSLLMAPEFLFRVEMAEPDPAHPRQYRLDAYSKASRLSFLLWDSAPDDVLLAAAHDGSIHTSAGLENQVSRMLASPRFEDGTRAFFADMFQLDGFENLTKDPAIYPKFNQAVSDSAKEQTLRTTVELLVHQRRDYRDLFTTSETFLNRPLASVYRVPFGAKDWAPYKFPDSAERSGILTQIAFLALNAHANSSSPTRRGIKMNEIFLCQATPDPPAEVDFSKVQDSTKGTVRGRLLDHMSNPGCVGCHKPIDPPGLALEHFDGLGQLRLAENGQPIDVTAELVNNLKLDGSAGLGKYLHDSPRATSCLVGNVYGYGVGHKPDDVEFINNRTKAFEKSGYRFPDLMSQIATSPEFFKVAVPGGTPAPAKSAAAASEKPAPATVKSSKGALRQ